MIKLLQLPLLRKISRMIFSGDKEYFNMDYSAAPISIPEDQQVFVATEDIKKKIPEFVQLKIIKVKRG